MNYKLLLLLLLETTTKCADEIERLFKISIFIFVFRIGSLVIQQVGWTHHLILLDPSFSQPPIHQVTLDTLDRNPPNFR